MNESIKKNNGSGKSREDLENDLIKLHLEQMSAHAGVRPREEIMEIGKKFYQVENELKAVGGSWKEVKMRMEKEMFEKIEAKRNGHVNNGVEEHVDQAA